MKMTAQIDFLQSEQSNGKLTEEVSILPPTVARVIPLTSHVCCVLLDAR